MLLVTLFPRSRLFQTMKSDNSKESAVRRVLKNRSLVIGLVFLFAAFFLSLSAVLPKTHHISSEESVPNVYESIEISLDSLRDIGIRYGGLWGNITFVSTSSSNLTFKLEHSNGTEYQKILKLTSHVPSTIKIEGSIPKEIRFEIPKEEMANLTYSYDLNYYSYPSSYIGVLAAILSILGAVLGMRGLTSFLFGITSGEEE